MVTSPAWSVKANNESRHCWNLGEGKRRRLNKVEYVDSEGYPLDDPIEWCEFDHTESPKAVGKVEWLRFIHAVQEYLEPRENPFLRYDDNGDEIPNKILRLNHYFYHVPWGEEWYYPYIEEYWVGSDLKFAIFLDNENSRARIECYDDNLVEVCEKAWKDVQESYEREFVARPSNV